MANRPLVEVNSGIIEVDLPTYFDMILYYVVRCALWSFGGSLVAAHVCS